LSFKTRIGYGKSNRLLDALSYMVESTPSVIKALSIKQGCVSCALVTRQLDGIGLGLAESGGSMKKKLNNAPTMSQLQKMSEPNKEEHSPLCRVMKNLCPKVEVAEKEK